MAIAPSNRSPEDVLAAAVDEKITAAAKPKFRRIAESAIQLPLEKDLTGNDKHLRTFMLISSSRNSKSDKLSTPFNKIGTELRTIYASWPAQHHGSFAHMREIGVPQADQYIDLLEQNQAPMLKAFEEYKQALVEYKEKRASLNNDLSITSYIHQEFADVKRMWDRMIELGKISIEVIPSPNNRTRNSTYMVMHLPPTILEINHDSNEVVGNKRSPFMFGPYKIRFLLDNAENNGDWLTSGRISVHTESPFVAFGITTVHPHVQTPGNPCWGVISEPLRNYLNECDFTAAWDILHRWSATFNNSSPYHRFGNVAVNAYGGTLSLRNRVVTNFLIPKDVTQNGTQQEGPKEQGPRESTNDPANIPIGQPWTPGRTAEPVTYGYGYTYTATTATA